MKIVQRNIVRRYEFDFGDHSLAYTVRDGTGERTVAIPYEAIPAEKESIKKGIRRVAHLSWGLLGISVVSYVMALQGDKSLMTAALAAALASIACSLFYRFYRLGYTNYKTPKGMLSVIHDKNRALIERAIHENWVRRMRELHASVDPAANPAAERKKIRWLKDYGVISEGEFNTLNAQLESFTHAGSPTIN